MRIVITINSEQAYKGKSAEEAIAILKSATSAESLQVSLSRHGVEGLEERAEGEEVSSLVAKATTWLAPLLEAKGQEESSDGREIMTISKDDVGVLKI